MASPGVPTRWALLVNDDASVLRVAGVYVATPEVKDQFTVAGGPWATQMYAGVMRPVVQVNEDEHAPERSVFARAGVGMRFRVVQNRYDDPPPPASLREAEKLKRRIAAIENNLSIAPPPGTRDDD